MKKNVYDYILKFLHKLHDECIQCYVLCWCRSIIFGTYLICKIDITYKSISNNQDIV